jgi:phosphate:Na+ symporter
MKRLFVFSLLSALMLVSLGLKADTTQLTTSATPEFEESMFENLHAKGIEGGAKISWNLNYKYVGIDELSNIVVKYKRKIDKKGPWNYLPPISADETSYKVKDLLGSEKYVWKIGMAKPGISVEDLISSGKIADSKDVVWSKKGKFKTEREWGVMKLLILLGSLGFFIYGMKIMSEGIQQAAGNRLRKILSTMTANRYIGVFSGFLITALVQSSSATTVMTVSFVNAGLLNLVQSAGVMMGANIGTTITGWLVSVFGFKISISSYALVIVALALPLVFVAKAKSKAWANFLIGFAILFMGLGFLKSAVPSLGHDSMIVSFFVDAYNNYPVFGPVMFVFLGALVTIVIQSSSAAMALTLTLVSQGIIPFPVAAAMILGENIGTTITAELASLIGNVHAKRSARIHSMFNIVGVTWMIFLIPAVLRGIAGFMDVDPFGDSEESRLSATLALSAFHTVFNLTNVLLLIWFVPLLVKLAIKSVKSRGEEDEVYRLEYLESGVSLSPELSILEAKKELIKFGKLTDKMSASLQAMIKEKDPKKKGKFLKKVARYEDIADKIEVEVSNFLTSMSQTEVSPELSTRIMGMLSIANDLERVADIIYQMGKNMERKTEEKIWFTEKHRANLNDMFKIVDESMDVMIENLEADYGYASLDKAKIKEKEINQFRNKLRKDYLKNIESSENIQSELIYNDMFSSAEKMGDHIINVSEALVGEF